MELANEKKNKSAQDWTDRVQRRHAPRVNYYSELRSWVQQVIREAEKSKDSVKKDQFLSLLKEL
jgi:hypothetical protein